MRNFQDTELEQAFNASMPEVPESTIAQGYAVDYGWTCMNDHLIVYRRVSHPDAGACTIDFLGYLLEPYRSTSRGDADDETPRVKYKVTRDETPAGDFSYHDPNDGAPLTRAFPTAHGTIRTNGCMSFSLYETHACRYDEMESTLQLVKDARDWAEDFAEIER